MAISNDKVYYCENAERHIFLTTPESPIPAGFIRCCADTANKIDGVFARLDAQTKAEHAQLTEDLYNQRMAKIARWRSDLNHELANCTDPNVRTFLRAALNANAHREEKLNRNTVYGVSAMQEREAPLAPSTTKVIHVADIPSASDIHDPVVESVN